ncbi:hypothetical protein Fleli_1187 [Bernardetia litoralis DSM 6794]|uniref:Sugar-binding protein n=1 Tax=Bernardetia litoralis (strain ATCC 23117 / DSM 6794 / NBRC 15988 / NCIMB 1366 / Fx l1 / Sio-4) TaxID=880071 RepID=I4AI40_BERLS|nr:hypothetical protein [Bernardetia litoralis]AFM03625.1 hypothetical protein Fleli_1187 [Bernardetia litoralis DSM 6794]
MRTFNLFSALFLFLNLSFSASETFAQNQIIAWQITTSDKAAEKHSVHNYDAQGRLTSVEEPLQNLKTDYIYDIEANLKRLDIYTTEGVVKVNYTYGSEPTTTIIHPVWGEQRRVSYKDERGKITEQKIYHNKELVRRILYSYTAFDSIFGREVVNFYEPTKDGKITPTLNFIFSGNKKVQNPVHKKYITYFDKTTRQRVKEVVFIDDKKPLETKIYTYLKETTNKALLEKVQYSNSETDEEIIIFYSYQDKTNLPTFVRTETRKNGNLLSYSSLEYLYQNGNLWQIITQNIRTPFNKNKTNSTDNSFTKKVSIFKDAKLIRERHYEGETLSKTIDYQYTKA